MPSKYYDVVVIGRSLGALVAAALLARRDYTVLVVGQGRPGANYDVDGRALRRRVSTMLAGTSPTWARVMRELAHTQTWRRRAVTPDPPLQVLGSTQAPYGSDARGRRPLRLEISTDAERFAREVDREVPEVRRLVAELYGELLRVTEAADASFEADAMWPPGTFFERRETNKLVAKLPFARSEMHVDLLGEFPRDHVYRRVVGESVRFATDLAQPLPAFAMARLHGAWARGLTALEGGEHELEELLLERVVANGGELALDERATHLEVKGGTVASVVLDGIPGGFGAGFVVTDLIGEAVANLSGGVGITDHAHRDWPRVTPSKGRFVTSIVARSAGVPTALGREVVLLGDERRSGVEGRSLHLERCGAAKEGEQLFAVEMLLDERDGAVLYDARRAIVERLCRELPFFAQHLVLVDSVHDGLPLWRYVDGIRVEVERVDARLSVRAEPMERQLEVDPPGFLGLGGEPLRGPIERTLLCGASVLPGLGREGRLLAALSAVRLVTKSDRRKTRFRREMWTKLEIE